MRWWRFLEEANGFTFQQDLFPSCHCRLFCTEVVRAKKGVRSVLLYQSMLTLFGGNRTNGDAIGRMGVVFGWSSFAVDIWRISDG